MKETEFDNLIKEKIDHLKAEHSAPNWDDFVNKVDHQLTEEEFDLKIKEKINNSQTPQLSGNWSAFLRRLNWFNLFNSGLLYNKLFESLILGLALFLIVPKYTADQTPEELFTPKMAEANNSYLQNSDGVFPHDSELLLFNEMSNLALEELNLQDQNSNAGEIISKETNETHLTQNLDWPATTKINPHTIAKFEENGVVNLIATPSISFFHNEIFIDPLPVQWAERNNIKAAADWVPPISLVGTHLQLSAHQFNLPPFNDQKEIETGESAYQLIVSAFSAMDINSIHTPYDEIYLKHGYEQSKFGFGGGFGLGWNKGRVTFETGMLFSMKQYDPKRVLELFRFNAETAKAISLKSIELNTLSIPLHFRFDISRGGRFIPYALIGGSINLATHANYQREEYFVSLRQPIPSDANINFSEESRLDQKRFTDGLLQGGKFSENHYLSFNGGLGVDYQLNKNWRLFAQTTYYLNFLETKLGPNNDHINTTSLQLGIRLLTD